MMIIRSAQTPCFSYGVSTSPGFSRGEEVKMLTEDDLQ